MKYNPQIHHRRSIRLKGYDYSQEGAYFITICVHNRKCLFGKIVDHEMILNEMGQIAHDEWLKLSDRFSHFVLDVFQIMPNHMHAIIVLNDPVGTTVGTTFAVVQNEPVVQNELIIPNNGNIQNNDIIFDIRTEASPVYE
ncbi:MAG: hypothetical protein WCX31_00040 [Salinivirgaceae bacterium]|jgi:hypothetical protein